MSDSVDEQCTHRIGQDYDEKRGVGNGPQLCLKCRVTLDDLIAKEALRERIDGEVRYSSRLISLRNGYLNLNEASQQSSDRLATLKKQLTEMEKSNE